MKTALFFDLEGTITDIKKKYYHIYKNIKKEKISMKDFWDDRINKIQQHKEDFKRLEHRYKRYNCNLLIAPSVFKMLSKFNDLYIITSSKHLPILSKIRKYFKKVVRGVVDKQKVISRIYKIKRYKRGVIIGDTEVEIIAAKNLGMTSIALTTGMRTEEQLKAFKPDIVADRFEYLFELEDYNHMFVREVND